MKLVSGTQLVQVISSEAPLGRAILANAKVMRSIQVAPIRQQFEVLPSACRQGTCPSAIQSGR